MQLLAAGDDPWTIDPSESGLATSIAEVAQVASAVSVRVVVASLLFLVRIDAASSLESHQIVQRLARTMNTPEKAADVLNHASGRVSCLDPWLAADNEPSSRRGRPHRLRPRLSSRRPRRRPPQGSRTARDEP